MTNGDVPDQTRWAYVPLEQLVRVDDTINYGVVQPGGDFPGGIPLARAGDLLKGRIDIANLKSIDPSIESRISECGTRSDSAWIPY